MAVADIINSNLQTAADFTDRAGAAVADIALPRHSIGFSRLGLDGLRFNAAYQQVARDGTPFPLYHGPTSTLPAAPVLTGLHPITAPNIPAAPSINTAGLFGHALPSTNMPQFSAASPHLLADQIYAAIAAVAFPVLDKVTLPAITPLSIGAMPTITLPGFNASPPPAQLGAPADYAAYYQQQYDQALPSVRHFVDDMMAGFISQYAPDFYAVRDKLGLAIQQELDGVELPHEAALFSRHQARIDRESSRAEANIINDPRYRGWIVPPGAQRAELSTLKVESLRSLSGASTDVFIEISRQRIQMRQYILSLADGQVNGVRAQALQFANHALAVHQAAKDHALALANMLVTHFEHEKSRAEFALALMRALDDRFKVELEAALSALTVYEAELKALSLKADVETKVLEAAKLQLDAQKLQVDTFSATIDAIAKRAVAEELKVKEFELKVRLFETEIKGIMASFDVYKAANDGDKAKVEGELAKQEVFASQIKAIALQVDTQKAIQQGDIQSNQAKLSQYTAGLSAYEATAKIALQRFTAEAEIKKLGLEVYKVDTEVNLEVFKGQLQQDTAFTHALVEVFRGNSASLTNYYGLQRDWANLGLHAQTAIATGYTNVAAAAVQATNAVASIAE